MKAPGIFFSHAKYAYFILIFSIILPAIGNTEQVHADYIQDTIQLAKNGDSQAQFSLFLLYDEGRVLEQDKQQALHWLKKSAEHTLPVACLYLGMKYEFGNGVQQNNITAKHYYKLAAEQGWAMAQYFLAMLLIKESDKKNLPQAAGWLLLAAEQGYPGAEEQLGKLKTQFRELQRKNIPILR